MHGRQIGMAGDVEVPTATVLASAGGPHVGVGPHPDAVEQGDLLRRVGAVLRVDVDDGDTTTRDAESGVPGLPRLDPGGVAVRVASCQSSGRR